MRMSVIVGCGCTRVFADEELVIYFMYEDEDEGVKAAKLYRVEKEFLSKQTHSLADTGVVAVLREPKSKTRWQRLLKKFV